VIVTCWPKSWKPSAGGSTTATSSIRSVPATGELTLVSTGSDGVAPSFSVSVVNVEPGETKVFTVSSSPSKKAPATAALLAPPADTSVTPRRPVTRIGSEPLPAQPWPTWPSEPLPQPHARPEASRASV
jgi:hypothetical protein